MSIEVVIDGSREGLEIKRALEGSDIECRLHTSYVVRWGSTSEIKHGKVTLNSQQSVKNALDKENMIAILKENHMRCPRIILPGIRTEFPIIGRKYNHESGSDIKVIDSLDEWKRSDCDYFLQYIYITDEYRVHVMDLKVFYIEQKYSTNIENIEEPLIRSRYNGWNLIKTDLSSFCEEEAYEIEELAAKAILSIGLDFGSVDIAKGINGKYYVIDVDAACRWMTQDLIYAYINELTETILRYDRMLECEQDITIGTDVECVIKDKDSGALIYASEFFTKDGMAGCDNRSIESGRRYFPLLEIRPDPSADPIEVVDSVKYIMRRISKDICYENIGLYGGSMPFYSYWVGGHIHFGIKPNSKLLKALNNYLALPIMMLEKVFPARSRMTKYGELGSFRLKFHGGFEYRTVSSWLISPEITAAVLCLAKVIVMEYLNLNEEFLCSYSDIKAYYSVNKPYFSGTIENVISKITITSSFELYRKYIEPLFNKIKGGEEWDEDMPINEAWSMTSNGKVFKPNGRCFVTKRKREELSIKLDEYVEIMIGRRIYKLLVYPKDNSTAEKENCVSFTGDICECIGIEETECIGLWRGSSRKIIRAGPVLGILSNIELDQSGPFGKQSFYFRKLIKFSKSKGMIVFVFTIKDIEWEENRVKGYTYDFKNDEWRELYFPIPDVIYDRGDVVNSKNCGQYAVSYINKVKEMKIQLINSLECINLINDKWGTFLLLDSFKSIGRYLPQTIVYNDDKQIIEYLKRYGHIFIKYRRGSRGKGIFSVKEIGENEFEITFKDRLGNCVKKEANRSTLIRMINSVIEEMGKVKKDYIIQKAVSFAKYNGNNFEIRVVMQKNSSGTWFRSCMVARCWGEDGEFINVANELDLGSSYILEDSLGKKAEQVANHIRVISKDIVLLMDGRGIKAGEVAIDFAVDEKLNIFILEMNSKPDNLLSSIKAFKMRNLAINRILEYGKFLVFSNDKEVEKSKKD